MVAKSAMPFKEKLWTEGGEPFRKTRSIPPTRKYGQRVWING